MSTISQARRRTALAAALVATGLGAVATAGAGASDAASPAATDAARTLPKTKITFEVPGCDGCEIGLTQARWDPKSRWGVRVWDGGQKAVADGVATFTVPTRHTVGMSAVVTAPWEGHTGYVTTVVFRYRGERPGDPVGFREARRKAKGTACWGGTAEEEVTIPLTVRKVRVMGLRHEVAGSIAYADTTQIWMKPMRRVLHGVMGSQDVNVCGEQPEG
ncbi:hypothetical protein [Nocardioides sp.]|uniref:hypothetical protein n=1 Tax=Nocardioides sp. TaxID=35761 RepID=UPI002EDB48DC